MRKGEVLDFPLPKRLPLSIQWSPSPCPHASPGQQFKKEKEPSRVHGRDRISTQESARAVLPPLPSERNGVSSVKSKPRTSTGDSEAL